MGIGLRVKTTVHTITFTLVDELLQVRVIHGRRTATKSMDAKNQASHEVATYCGVDLRD